MGTLSEDLTAIKNVEDTLIANKVARFSYTDTAYTNNDANGVDSYNFNNEQNIPNPTTTVLKVNSTVLDKGYRAQASSITRMLINHFFGRVSYNLNKINDNMSALIATLRSHTGTANGFATLDDNALIPYTQLPVLTKSVCDIVADSDRNVDLTQQNDITKILSKKILGDYIVPLGSNWRKVSQIFTPTSTLHASIYSAFCHVNSIFFLGVNGNNPTQNTYISKNEGETFTLLVTNFSLQNIVYIESTHTYMGVFTHYDSSTSKYNVEVHTCSGDPTSWNNWQLHSTLSSNINSAYDKVKLKLFSDPDIGDTVLLFYQGIFSPACGVSYLTSENTWYRIFSDNYLSDVTFDENGQIYFSVLSGTYNETIKIYRVDGVNTLTLIVDITLSSTVQGINVRSFTQRHTIYNKFDRCFYAEVGNIIIGIPLDNPTTYTSYLSSYAPTSSNEKDLKLIGNENCPYLYAFIPKSSDKTLYAGVATLKGATLIYEGEQTTIDSLYEKSDCSFALYLNKSVCLAILTMFSRDGLNFLKSRSEGDNRAMIGHSAWSSLTLQTENAMYLVLNGVLYKSDFDTCMW